RGHAEGGRSERCARPAVLAPHPSSEAPAAHAQRQGRLAPGAQDAEGDRDAVAHRARGLTRPRAIVVVTGSELVRGERTDRNGPFLASEALRLGMEPARIIIVGDNPHELEAALREGIEADACLVSGGAGGPARAR